MPTMDVIIYSINSVNLESATSTDYYNDHHPDVFLALMSAEQ